MESQANIVLDINEDDINKIEKVTKQEIIDFAKTMKINTIYFLRN